MATIDDRTNPLLSDSSRAWDELIESIGPASLLLLVESRMSAALRRQTTAEDVFQEALLHAWRDRAQFEWRGLKSFRAWLLTIIDHRIHRAAESQASLKRGGAVAVIAASALGGSSTAGDSNWPGPLGSTTPSRIAMYREQAAAMQAALDALPDESREIVRLRLFEQLTLEEVAARLETTVAAVRYRFGRGAERYRQLLRSQMTSASRTAAPQGTVAPQADPSP